MAPLVSVVIVNYNYGRYLRQAIDSVLDQENFQGEVECIVVDDGSTDDSHAILTSFAERIRVISQKNQGQAAAYNNGFQAAQGEFVCMLDSDDYWARTKLSQVMPRFDDPEVGAVQHYLRDVTASGRAIKRRLPDWPATYDLEDFLNRRIHMTATSGLTFRKSVLDRVLPLPTEIFHFTENLSVNRVFFLSKVANVPAILYYIDDLLLIKALFLSKIANVPVSLGFYRIHGLNHWAGGYQSPEKLALDIQMRENFHHELQPWLNRYGKRLSRHYLDQEDLEYFRRRILLYMLRGERGRAISEWGSLVKKYWTHRFGLFRAATCFLALVSPQLYLKAYEYYSQWGLIAHIRFRVFPE